MAFLNIFFGKGGQPVINLANVNLQSPINESPHTLNIGSRFAVKGPAPFQERIWPTALS